MRCRFSWYRYLMDHGTLIQIDYFFHLLKKLRKGKTMSQNRCAYYTLRHFHSTTTIAELVDKLGISKQYYVDFGPFGGHHELL